MKKISTENIENINNPSLLEYTRIYKNIEQSTKDHIQQFGMPFEEEDQSEQTQERMKQLKEEGGIFRNNGKSILSNNRISSACEACQTGSGSYTSFVSLKCHRDCYFCFNKNQDNYHFYLNNKKNVNGDLETMLNDGVIFTHLALTGGEPLLHPDETLAFFQLANIRCPDTHTRLYTAGDLLTEQMLIGFKDAGLNEIRFSIKMEDSPQKRKHILRKIALAKRHIPDVLVEMPVIPGTREEMEELLLQLEALDVYGINLLEFCFPLENAQAFREKGFSLKNPPYDVYYNFWYAGGLAVAESEKLCLELVDFAIKRGLKLGVHYCSLENKFTGQIYQQNINQSFDDTYYFSPVDYYLKTAKVFGFDKNPVRKILKKQGITFNENDDYDYLQFPVEAVPLLGNKQLDIVISSNVVEEEQGRRAIREVQLEWTLPVDFELDKWQGEERV